MLMETPWKEATCLSVGVCLPDLVFYDSIAF